MFWFDASFDDVPLRIVSLTTDDGRDIVVQSPSRGSKHFLQDRGAKLGRVNAEIVFVDEPRAADYRDRFEEFRAVVQKPGAKILSHPVIGAYPAVAEGGQFVVDAQRQMITYSCSFVPENEPQTVSKIMAGVSPIAGVQAVEVACEEADLALEALDLASDAPGNALERVTEWAGADELDSQDVIVGVESLTAEINEAIDELELTASLERFPAYQAMIGLAYSVRRAATSLTNSTAHAIPLHVEAATPLLTICAGVYGAELAEEMADVVARRNRIRTPGLIPAGTTLSIPAIGA